MKQQIINNVMQGMLKYLNNAQAIQLQKVLEKEFRQVAILECEREETEIENNNLKLTEFFLAAKRVEGCSEKSLKYYKSTIEMMLDTIGKRVQEIETNDLREYLTNY